jgi:hypothetical protein
MGHHPDRIVQRVALALLGAALLVGSVPAAAVAQAAAGKEHQQTRGERYHAEFATGVWHPDLSGDISSDALSLVGSRIDFAKDLGLSTSAVATINIVLRPGKKHRFRAEFAPIRYEADTTFSRIITFAGIPFPVSLPIHSTLSWRTWRFGYEYDFIYRKWGFVGVLFEARTTKLDASLSSAAVGGVTSGSAILPAIGIVARGYVLPRLAVNFELSGFCALHTPGGQFAMKCKPDANPDYQATYFDWDIYGTINVTNYVGAQVGWRRQTTTLDFGTDRGALAFQGLWIGGVVRY